MCCVYFVQKSFLYAFRFLHGEIAPMEMAIKVMKRYQHFTLTNQTGKETQGGSGGGEKEDPSKSIDVAPGKSGSAADTGNKEGGVDGTSAGASIIIKFHNLNKCL